MGLGNHVGDNHIDCNVVDDGDSDVGGSPAGGKSFGHVSCSICLEVVTDDGDRSWAKLQCGHRFHLDCIGSAFNAKGAMQCPNCRKIEKGQWLYANGSRSFPEFNIEEWIHDGDLYDLSHSEMLFGVNWCPFGSATRLLPSFEDGEFSSSSYHDLSAPHPIMTEQPTAPSSTHPCPYMAYFGPLHPSSSNSTASVSDAPSFNNHPSVSSVPGEMPASYAFPSMDHHYHNWEHHSSHIGNADQPRSPRYRFDLPGSASFIHPFSGHSSSARAGSSLASTMVPPYPGSNARTRNRVEALQAYYQLLQPTPDTRGAPMMSGTWGSIGGMAPAGPTRNYSQEVQIPFPDQFMRERDHHSPRTQVDRDSRR